MTDTWNPAQYDKFQRERDQAFFDLLALVRGGHARRIADLGCGTGRLTRLLHSRLEACQTIGIDRSARMLEAQRGKELPHGLGFEVGTIESFPGDRGPFDVIFSNSAFHWVEDHPSLVARLGAALNSGGQLAFQLPAQHDDLPHQIAEELAQAEPFAAVFAGWHRPQPVLMPEMYARLLHHTFAEQEVRLIVYPHVLPGPEDVVEWMRGTLLTDYARQLPPELFDRFVDEYRKRLLGRLEPARPFFFPFKRILCWGQRA